MSTTSSIPIPLPNIEAIPDELRTLPQWVLWNFQVRSGKKTKVPINACLASTLNRPILAKSDRPDTWTTFEKVLSMQKLLGNKGIAVGIGFVFAESGGLVGIDLDNCIEEATGNLKPWAADIIESCNTYAEVSPSGAGVKLFGRGTLPTTKTGTRQQYHDGALELYQHGRFFTVTGLKLPDAPSSVVDCENQLSNLWSVIAPRKHNNASTRIPNAGWNGSTPRRSRFEINAELLTRIRNSKQNEKFNRLWNGDFGDYTSQSEADLALCNILAFYVGPDAGRIDNLFRQSGLMRDKWERKDYRVETMRKAIDSCQNQLEQMPLNGSHSAFDEDYSSAESESALTPKLTADEADPATEAIEFLSTFTLDGVYQLRFWKGGWWEWKDGRYFERSHSEIRSAVIRKLNTKYSMLGTSVTSNVIDHVKAYAELESRTEAPAWIAEFSPNWAAADILATRSKIVHIPSLESGNEALAAATPRLFTTSALDFDFDPSAPPPVRWLAFLEALWKNDPESIETLQEWFGYVLTPDTSQQKIFMLIGPPRSGKGTIARVLQRLVGNANCAGPTLAGLETNFGLSPLLGKSLAIIADARLSGRIDQSKVVERLLSISGEDSLTVDRKHREPITGKMSVRLMIASNELPRLAESSGALANRMIICRLTRDFLGKEDTQLTDKLLAELPGILLWAITGWQRLRDRGYFIQPKGAAELADEMKDLCSPIAMFVRECCKIGPNNQAAVDDLYAAWCKWCEANGRQHPGNVQTFGRDLRSVVTDLRSTKPREGNVRYRAYDGIRLLT